MLKWDEYIADTEDFSVFYVSGTFHGSHIYTDTEGSARKIFHQFWKGESIIDVRDNKGKIYQSLPKNYDDPLNLNPPL